MSTNILMATNVKVSFSLLFYGQTVNNIKQMFTVKTGKYCKVAWNFNKKGYNFQRYCKCKKKLYSQKFKKIAKTEYNVLLLFKFFSLLMLLTTHTERFSVSHMHY